MSSGRSLVRAVLARGSESPAPAPQPHVDSAGNYCDFHKECAQELEDFRKITSLSGARNKNVGRLAVEVADARAKQTSLENQLLEATQAAARDQQAAAGREEQLKTRICDLSNQNQEFRRSAAADVAQLESKLENEKADRKAAEARAAERAAQAEDQHKITTERLKQQSARELEELRAKYAQLEAEKLDEERSFSTYRKFQAATIARLKQEIASLKERNQRQKEWEEQKRQQFQQKIELLKQDLSNSDASGGELRSQILALSSSNSALRDELERKQHSLANREARIAELDLSNTGLNSQLEQAHQEGLLLRQELAGSKQHGLELADQLSEAKTEVSRLKALEGQLLESQKELRERTAKLEECQARNQILSVELQRVAPFEAQYQQAQEQIEELKHQLSRSSDSVNGLEDTSARYLLRIAEQAERIGQLEDEIAGGDSKLLRTEAELRAEQAKCEALENENAMTNAELRGTQEELDRQTELAGWHSRAGESKDEEMLNLREQLEGLEAQLRAALEAKIQTQRQAAEREAELQAELLQLRSELENIRAGYKGKMAENIELKDALEQKSTANQGLGDQLSALQSELKERNTECEHLKAALARSQAALESACSARDGLQSKCSDLEGSLEREAQRRVEVVDGLEQKLSQKQSKLDATAAELRQEQADLSKEQGEHELLKQQHQGLLAEAAGFKAKSKEQLEALKAELAALKEQLAGLQKQLADTKSALKAKIAELEAIKQAMDKTSGESKEYVTQLTGELSLTKSQLQDTASQLASSELKLAAAQEANRGLAEDNGELSGRLEDLGTQHSQLQHRTDAEIANLSANLAKSTASLEEQHKEGARLRSALEAEQNDTRGLRNDLAASRAGAAEIEARLGQQVSELQQHLKSAQEELEGLSRDKARLAAELQELRDLAARERGELEKQIQDMVQARSTLTGEITQLKSDLRNRNKRIEYETQERHKAQSEKAAAIAVMEDTMLRAGFVEREASASRKEMEAKMNSVAREVEADKLSREEARNKVRMAEQRLRKQTAENSVLHNTCDGLEQQKKEMERDRRTQARNMKDLLKSSAAPGGLDQGNAIRALQEELALKESQIGSAARREKALNEDIRVLTLEVHEARASGSILDDVREAKEELARQLAELKQVELTMRIRNDALAEEVAHLRKIDVGSKERDNLLLTQQLEHSREELSATLEREKMETMVLARISGALDKERHQKRSLLTFMKKSQEQLASQLPPGLYQSLAGFSGPGMLTIKLQSAHGLPQLPEHELEISEKSSGALNNDPYVRFKSGVNVSAEEAAGRRVQSTVAYSGGSSPSWGEELQLCTPGNDEDLMIKVMDWEKYGAHRLLAQGFVELSSLSPREPKHLEVPLQPSGKLVFVISYEPTLDLRNA